MSQLGDLIVKNIKHRMVDLDYDQKDVAKLAGMNKVQFGKYHNGESEPGPAVLERIARALKCEPWELLIEEHSLNEAEKGESQGLGREEDAYPEKTHGIEDVAHRKASRDVHNEKRTTHILSSNSAPEIISEVAFLLKAFSKAKPEQRQGIVDLILGFDDHNEDRDQAYKETQESDE